MHYFEGIYGPKLLLEIEKNFRKVEVFGDKNFKRWLKYKILTTGICIIHLPFD